MNSKAGSPAAPSSRIHGGADVLGVPLHDFSTNSNACGPCPLALVAVRSADATAYPDSAYAALRQALAAFHRVVEERIVLAASASEFIFRITSWAARQGGAAAVWLPPNGYGDYAQAALAHHLPVVANAGDALLRWSCDPSSPLGQPHIGLGAIAATAGGVTVLDRAYEPLRLQGALALTDDEVDSVWQLWTPNKALGLTGVRAAYAIAPAGPEGVATANALEQLCPSWPVGAHGAAMLQSWTTQEVQSWLLASLASLREWKARQVAICESLGWACEPSVANFLCARPPLPSGMNLPEALAALRRKGIKLRDTTSFGLPGQVRLGVLAPLAQDALHNAWLHMMDSSQ